jgi:hypothetical protein
MQTRQNLRYGTGLITVALMTWGLWFAIVSGKLTRSIHPKDYPLWRYKMEVMEGKISFADSPQVLFLGDSTATAAINPIDYNQPSLSLAIGGTTPVEMYYALKNYLKHYPAPRKIIYVLTPYHYAFQEIFAKKTLTYRFLSWEELREVGATMQKFKNYFYPVGVTLSGLEGLGFLLSPPSLFLLDIFLSQLALSPLQQASLSKDLILAHKKDQHAEVYKKIVKDQGHLSFGDQPIGVGAPNEVHFLNFRPNPVFHDYLKRTIALALEHKIQFILEQAPIKSSSFFLMTDRFKTDYIDFLRSLSVPPEHQALLRVQERFFPLSDDHFTDSTHVNLMGMQAYQAYVQQRYFDQPSSISSATTSVTSSAQTQLSACEEFELSLPPLTPTLLSDLTWKKKTYRLATQKNCFYFIEKLIKQDNLASYTLLMDAINTYDISTAAQLVAEGSNWKRNFTDGIFKGIAIERVASRIDDTSLINRIHAIENFYLWRKFKAFIFFE